MPDWPGGPATAVAGLASVVMPCFNAAAYLEAAIDSVLAQDYRPLELIVVDDGSTDGSGARARAFGLPVVVLTQENQGIAAARNAGLRHTRGEYIGFCDADDVWAPGALRARIGALREHVDRDYVYGLVQNFLSPEVGEELARTLMFPTEPVRGRLAGALVVRREAFSRVGLFDPAKPIGETMDWLGRAADAGLTACMVDRVVLSRRIHGANSTLRARAAPRHYLAVLKAALDRRREGQT